MKTLNSHEQQQQQMKTHPGFIAALDQSGGSTPNALRRKGRGGICAVMSRLIRLTTSSLTGMRTAAPTSHRPAREAP